MSKVGICLTETKMLSSKLGVVEVIHANPTNDSDTKQHQTFQFLIVIDFESTCWEENINGSQPEIIEFPAVLLNLKTGIIEEEFWQYVLPVENPKLSKFCMELTGIKQEDVDNGVPLQTCLSLFYKWIKKISTEKKLIFPNTFSKIKDNKCAFVTWSDWDFRVCLHNECQRKQIYKPEYFTQWIDLRATYKEFYKGWPQGLKGALSELGLTFEGQEHSGLCDARNTAHLAWKMIQDGVALQLTSSLQKQKSMVKEQKCNNEVPVTQSPKSHKRVPLKQINTSVYRNIAAKKTMQQPASGNTHCIKTHTPIGNSKTLQFMCTPKITILHSKHFTPKQLIHTAPHSSAKRTPPFCKCGRRAACKTASLPGPNQGRIFFSCPKRRSLGMVQMSGCSFFCWAS